MAARVIQPYSGSHKGGIPLVRQLKCGMNGQFMINDEDAFHACQVGLSARTIDGACCMVRMIHYTANGIGCFKEPVDPLQFARCVNRIIPFLNTQDTLASEVYYCMGLLAKMTRDFNIQPWIGMEAAVDYFTIAARLNHSEAQLVVGNLCAERGIITEACTWWNHSSGQGNADAQVAIALYLISCMSDIPTAMSLLNLASVYGNLAAAYLVYDIYMNRWREFGMKREAAVAMDWLRVSTSQIFSPIFAIYEHARIYQDMVKRSSVQKLVYGEIVTKESHNTLLTNAREMIRNLKKRGCENITPILATIYFVMGDVRAGLAEIHGDFTIDAQLVRIRYHLGYWKHCKTSEENVSVVDEDRRRRSHGVTLLRQILASNFLLLPVTAKMDLLEIICEKFDFDDMRCYSKSIEQDMLRLKYLPGIYYICVDHYNRKMHETSDILRILFDMKAEVEYPDIQLMFGRNLIAGSYPTKKNVRLGISWIRRAAAGGVHEAQEIIGKYTRFALAEKSLDKRLDSDLEESIIVKCLPL